MGGQWLLGRDEDSASSRYEGESLLKHVATRGSTLVDRSEPRLPWDGGGCSFPDERFMDGCLRRVVGDR